MAIIFEIVIPLMLLHIARGGIQLAPPYKEGETPPTMNE